jgi:hypothetical protein
VESPGVQDLLARLGAALPIRTRAMFGGVGIYSGELFFALILDQRLYFRVDGATRPAYAARGSEPFQTVPRTERQGHVLGGSRARARQPRGAAPLGRGLRARRRRGAARAADAHETQAP